MRSAKASKTAAGIPVLWLRESRLSLRLKDWMAVLMAYFAMKFGMMSMTKTAKPLFVKQVTSGISVMKKPWLWRPFIREEELTGWKSG